MGAGPVDTLVGGERANRLEVDLSQHGQLSLGDGGGEQRSDVLPNAGYRYGLLSALSPANAGRSDQLHVAIDHTTTVAYFNTVLYQIAYRLGADRQSPSRPLPAHLSSTILRLHRVLFVISTLVPAAASPAQLQTTARSVLGQNCPTNWSLQWRLNLTATTAERLGQTLDELRHDSRVEVVVLASEVRPAGARANAALSGVDLDAVRFVPCGDRLLPGGMAADALALADAPWCASAALDEFADSHYRAAIEYPAGPVPVGTIVDQWSQPSSALSVHPLTAAYRREVFDAVGRCDETVGYGVETDLLAQVNERSAGAYSSRPSLIITGGTPVDPANQRPNDFHGWRLARTRALAMGRQSRVAPSAPSEAELWDAISARAWTEADTGHARVPADAASLSEVLLQARKYHFRFAWPALAVYGQAAVQMFPDDDYLRAMWLTGRAATEGAWDDAVEFITSHENPKIQQLLLTTAFVEGEAVPTAVLRRCAQLAADLHEIDDSGTGRAVAAYRAVSMHRLLGEFDRARSWATTASCDLTDITDDPALVAHLRERLIVETTALSTRADNSHNPRLSSRP